MFRATNSPSRLLLIVAEQEVTMVPPRVDPKTRKLVIVDPQWSQPFEFYGIGKRDILEIEVASALFLRQSENP